MEKEKKEETKKLTVKARIVKISNEIRLEKGGRNEFIKHNYFRPDDILQALNPLLEKYSLIAIFNMDFHAEKMMYKGTLRIEDFGSEERVVYRFEIPPTEVKGASKGQNAGATQTYCKRYLMMNAFNIAVNKDDPDSKKAINTVTPVMVGNILKSILSSSDIMMLQEKIESVEKSKSYTPKDKKEILSLMKKRIDELKK